jgi:hypothetical protein
MHILMHMIRTVSTTGMQDGATRCGLSGLECSLTALAVPMAYLLSNAHRLLRAPNV